MSSFLTTWRTRLYGSGGHTLGLLRFSLCLALLAKHFSPFGGRRAPEAYPGTYSTPTWIDGLGLPYPPSGPVEAQLRFIIALVLIVAAVGLLTRASLALAGALCTYEQAYYSSAGTFDHHMGVVCQLLLFMACVPGVQSLSLDRCIVWAWQRYKNQAGPFWRFVAQPRTVGWGTWGILIILSVLYCSAGASKLRFGGLQWLDGSTLSFYVSGKPNVDAATDVQKFFNSRPVNAEKAWRDGHGLEAYHYGHYQSGLGVKLGRFIASKQPLMAALSVGTIIIELGFPIVLLGGWYRNLMLLAAIAMHIGIGFLMGLSFNMFRLVCFLMLDWELILQTLAARGIHLRRPASAADMPPRHAPGQ